VLDQIKADKLRIYSVWVPILFSDVESAVPNAAKKLPDKRVTHYWDSQGELVEAYKTILPTKREENGEYIKAWDVYLLFPPGAEWKDKPPAPSYWMHQLPLDPKNRLDGEALAAEVRRLLK
jgi:hypothetical protein